MRRICTFLLMVVGASAMAGATAVTPDVRDLESARNVAMGGAYEALGYGAEAIGGNPAALTLYKRYQIEASGAWDIPQGYGFGTLGLADSTNPVAMGISYHFATYGGTERRYAHLTTVAAAYSFGELVHLGLTARNYILVGPSATNSISINAGLIVKPVSFLTLGFSGHNLISVWNVDVPRYFVASIAMQFLGQLSPAFDLRMDFNQPAPRLSYSGGIEWLIAQTFPVRVGYQYDGIADGVSKRQYLSGGIGWFSEGSGIDLAYRHELGGANGRMVALTLKLQL